MLQRKMVNMGKHLGQEDRGYQLQLTRGLGSEETCPSPSSGSGSTGERGQTTGKSR